MGQAAQPKIEELGKVFYFNPLSCNTVSTYNLCYRLSLLVDGPHIANRVLRTFVNDLSVFFEFPFVYGYKKLILSTSIVILPPGPTHLIRGMATAESAREDIAPPCTII